MNQLKNPAAAPACDLRGETVGHRVAACTSSPAQALLITRDDRLEHVEQLAEHGLLRLSDQPIAPFPGSRRENP